MDNRIIKVFYDENALPFKDASRTTHYPVMGNAFMGASNTTEIRFYTRDIGGVNRQWLVIGKLANGRKGFQLLSNPQLDNTLDEPEYYYSFHLSSYFTQLKGDVLLSLGGYTGGEITLNEDEVYELGDMPIIETTGVIKLNIAYATTLPSDTTLEVSADNLLALFGTKLDTNMGIVRIATKSTVDLSDYQDNQMFYVEDEYSFYVNNNGSWQLQYDLNAYRDKIGIILVNGGTISGVTLTDEEYAECLKPICFVITTTNNQLYLKTNEDSTYVYLRDMKWNVSIINQLYMTYTNYNLVITKSTKTMGAHSPGSYQATLNSKTYKWAGNLSTRPLGDAYSVYGNFYACSHPSGIYGFMITEKNGNNYSHKFFTNDGYYVANSVSFTYTISDLVVNANKHSYLTDKDAKTISALLTFTTLPQSSVNPTNDNDLVRKGYVDSKTGNVGDTTESGTGTLQAQINESNTEIANVKNDYVPKTQKGAANGVATLDANSKIPTSQLPDSITGQVLWGGTLYISDAHDRDSYWLENTGFVDVSQNVKNLLGITTSGSVTVNGIETYGSDNLIKYSDLKTAIINAGAKAVGIYFIISARRYQNGYISSYQVNLVDKDISLTSISPITNCSTGDWLVINNVRINYIYFAKIDNTDAVSSVNGQTGAVVLDGTDIEMGGGDNTKLDVEINKKINTTDADDKYQSKIRHADLLAIPSGSWQLDGDEYSYTSEDLYYYLGLVNTDDLAELVGIDADSRNAIADHGIYLDNVTTTDGHTYAYLKSKFLPQENVSLSIVITKQYGNYGHSADVLTINDIDDDTIKLENSKLTVDKSKFVNVVTLYGTDTLADILNAYGDGCNIIFSISGSNDKYRLGISSLNTYLCKFEIESTTGKTRYSSNGVSKSNTLSAVMSSTYQANYIVEGNATKLYKHSMSFTYNGESYTIVYYSNSYTAVTNLMYLQGETISLGKWTVGGVSGNRGLNITFSSGVYCYLTYIESSSGVIGTKTIGNADQLTVTDTVTEL